VVLDELAARVGLDEAVDAERLEPEVVPERFPVRIPGVRVGNPGDLVEFLDAEGGQRP
jgi:hypothetical protein